jgi:hypothetical protein
MLLTFLKHSDNTILIEKCREFIENNFDHKQAVKILHHDKNGVHRKTTPLITMLYKEDYSYSLSEIFVAKEKELKNYVLQFSTSQTIHLGSTSAIYVMEGSTVEFIPENEILITYPDGSTTKIFVEEK